MSSGSDETRCILGIDPGTNALGFGLLNVNGKECALLHLGVFKLHKLNGQSSKLRKIYDHLTELIEEYRPGELAIEAPFYGKNVQSMLKLGRAQGVVIAAALSANLRVTEYSPRKIKQSITGNGNASKEQVASMLQTLLKMPDEKLELDATDALATALCHFYQGNQLFGAKKYSGWSSFASKNPDRLLQ